MVIIECVSDAQKIQRLLEPMHDAPSRREEFKSGYDHGPETPWRLDVGAGETEYRVHASRSMDEYVAPGALVRVTRPATGYDLHAEVGQHSKDWSSDYQEGKFRIQRGDGPDGQGALFDVTHRSPYVSFMATHPDMRAHIPTMLSVANLETQERYREPLRPDNDLSVHSSKIVHRLAEAGAIEAPAHEQRNALTTENYRNFTVGTRHNYGSASEVPATTVQRGRQFLREALGRPKQAVENAVTSIGDKKGKQERLFEDA